MNYLLKPLLNTALEKYFANIGPDMNLSMFSGQIELQKLLLRKTTINEKLNGLPFSVEFGGV
jgi:hypothetical protein